MEGLEAKVWKSLIMLKNEDREKREVWRAIQEVQYFSNKIYIKKEQTEGNNSNILQEDVTEMNKI